MFTGGSAGWLLVCGLVAVMTGWWARAKSRSPLWGALCLLDPLIGVLVVAVMGDEHVIETIRARNRMQESQLSMLKAEVFALSAEWEETEEPGICQGCRFYRPSTQNCDRYHASLIHRRVTQCRGVEPKEKQA